MSDLETLKPLVERVVELASRPDEERKKELWARHNDLQPTGKIPVCVTWEGMPAPQWDLVFGAGHLACGDPVARSIEFDLRKRVWAAENVPDDHVVWPAVAVAAVAASPHDWGVELGSVSPDDELGAMRFIAAFADRIDVSRLRHPVTEIDEAATRDRLARAEELTGGRLQVYPRYPTLGESPFEPAVRMRGMERIFLDPYDAPAQLHELMDFITDSIVTDHLRRAERGWINCAVDASGRYQMPSILRNPCAFAPPEAERGSIAAEWPYVSAQSASGLGPEMYEEFVHRYNSRIAGLYGRVNVYYHGCECLDAKLGVISALPNLRRHHVSPWSSVEMAARHYRGRVVLEVHSHPGKVFFGWTEDQMRAELEGLVAAAAGHPMNLNLSDIHSVNGDPSTLTTWARLAQEASTA